MYTSKIIMNDCLKRFGICIFFFSSFLDCSSKLSLWREKIQRADINGEKGILEISIDNLENTKIESLYFHFFFLYDKELVKDPKNLPSAFQIHKGELHYNSPYQIQLPAGEYYASLLSGKDSINRHDLMLSFEAYFGLRYESTSLAFNPSYKKTKCSIEKQILHHCQMIIVKKNERTKIIIQIQKEIPIKSEMDIKFIPTPQGIPLPIPHQIVTRETPEVLIEVQNPK
ncbi:MULTISPECIES: hypothetical protein [unclassified Leptospira]|uniref:hypothetical protein n=1 Tax=unclassified Leptospira TaxID=2633828 RepID=UPI0002BDD8FD|nr:MULTISPECIES: hypothetical protein [unclassified Leptospira]EMK00484.1 hypothetical protein LEP1GSC192_2131 [Leptospira sp. B5-022]MCR1793771.1 hypothetical protein [Leptospira sp. id769339]